MPRVIFIGCGFLGEAAADFFCAAGWNVLGLCATAESAARLAAKPYEVQARDVSSEFAADHAWRGADALVHCVSSGRGGAEDYRAAYLDGLLNVMTAFQPRRTMFVSSTSVYGQTDGSWVDENSETAPARETSRVLLDAEGVALASGGYVARLSGLYGPSRSVLRQRFLSGGAVIEGNGSRWINQIHRDDAVRAIAHLFMQRSGPGIYNVSDDVPAMQRDVYRWLSESNGRSLPPSGEPDFSRKRGWTSKRVSNAKLRQAGWLPQFPSYRDALSTPGAL